MFSMHLFFPLKLRRRLYVLTCVVTQRVEVRAKTFLFDKKIDFLKQKFVCIFATILLSLQLVNDVNIHFS